MLRNELLAAVRTTLVTLIGVGLAYPLVTTAVAGAIFPQQASGSMVSDDYGNVVGSGLIAQPFAKAGYLQPRPSAAGEKGYDAAGSSGSNLGPTSKALRDRAAKDLQRLIQENPNAEGPVPAELVSASASGLDPHLSRRRRSGRCRASPGRAAWKNRASGRSSNRTSKGAICWFSESRGSTSFWSTGRSIGISDARRSPLDSHAVLMATGADKWWNDPGADDETGANPKARGLSRAGRAGKARPPQAIRRVRRRGGKDVPDAAGRARSAAPRGGRGDRLHRAARPPGDVCADRRAGSRAPAPHRVSRRSRRGDGSRRRAAAPAHRRGGGRDPAYQRAGVAQPQALPGRARASGRPDQRDRRNERAAPGVAQWAHRARDRRGGARDRSRHLPHPGRPGGEPRSGGRGPAGAPPLGEDVRSGKDPLGAGELLQGSEPGHPAGAGPARGRGEPGSRRSGEGRAGGEGVRAGDGVPRLQSPAREDAALARVAHGRPPKHGLVRRLRGNAGRGAEPDRLRGAAPPARQRREGSGARRRSGAAEIG